MTGTFDPAEFIRDLALEAVRGHPRTVREQAPPRRKQATARANRQKQLYAMAAAACDAYCDGRTDNPALDALTQQIKQERTVTKHYTPRSGDIGEEQEEREYEPIEIPAPEPEKVPEPAEPIPA